MLRDVLNLTTVSVNRENNTSDGMGGWTVTTTSTTLTLAAIFQAGSARPFLSDVQLAVSTHVLVTDPSYYTWDSTDKTISYNGDTYDIVGRPDNILEKGELMVVPLQLQ